MTRRVMREEGLEAKAPKGYPPKTTDSRNMTTPSPDLLKEHKSKVFGVGEAIVSDIKYLPMTNGRFCYLTMFQDVKTNRIVGWDVASRMLAEMVCDASKMGLCRGDIKKNAIIHTDRGSQYSSKDYRKLIGMRLRLSIRAKSIAMITQWLSFFSRFKIEIDTRIFNSVEDARSTALDYIECFYNRTGQHSTLGMSIPTFEKMLKEGFGNDAHVESVESLETAYHHSHNRLEKPKPLSHITTAATLLINKLKGDKEKFLS